MNKKNKTTTQKKTKPLATPSRPVRLQTAEGWKRSMLAKSVSSHKK